MHLLISTALLASSCGSVPIQEENFYTDRGQDGAVITHFFSTASADISKTAWDSMREGMTCMSPEAIGHIKGSIEKLCTKVSCSQVSVTEYEAPSATEMAEFRQSVYDLNQFLGRLSRVSVTK